MLRDRRLASCDYMPEVSTSVPYSRLPKMDISLALDLPSPCHSSLSPPPLLSPLHQFIILFHCISSEEILNLAGSRWASSYVAGLRNPGNALLPPVLPLTNWYPQSHLLPFLEMSYQKV